MDKYVGKRLDGRYEIQEIIGVGGMAVVYKARDNQENRTVAIKILKDEFVSNEEFLRRFKNESKAIAMLSHQNIVNVYDVSFGDLIQYIVMEYIEGITLKEFIEREGSLRWKDAVHFTLQILKALQHAHDKGIVHRDVKPQNIMVLPDGTIKVTDFGIARFARSDQRTITDKAIGSVHYISPEQARGEKTDEKADIYSVGVMLYEMLTGKLPFQAESAVSVAIMQLQRDPQLPTEINSSIPLGLEQITMHAMQKTPERRYQSAAEMLCDLDKFRKDPALTFEYNYFVDSSPTKFVDSASLNAGVAVAAEKAANIDNEPEAKNEKSGIIPILAGIAVALVIAVIALLIIFLPKLLGKTGQELVCPDFVGKTWTEVQKDKEYNDNFDFEVEWGNSEYDYGYIYGQSEKEGAKLKKDHKITLQVSMGQKTVKVPDVSNKTESAAVTELRSKGLNPVIQTEPSEDYEKGIVIRTDPARTTTVAEGANVTIYVSSGKTTKKVKVPDVIGMEQKAAEDELKKEGLVPQIEEVRISTNDRFYPIGLVVKQDPKKSSTEVEEGTTVKISVCTGYTFDVEIDDLPTTFNNGTYYISLWEGGKMIDSGDKIDSTATTSYTFDKIETTEKKLTVTVRVSSEKDSEQHDLYDYLIDIESGKIKLDTSYEDYLPESNE